jgi:hypothetical protein
MVPELRKRHRIIWQIGAVVLVFGFVAAILVLPKPNKPSSWEQPIAAPMAKKLATQQSEWFEFTLRGEGKNVQQLEVVTKKTLNIPSVQLFWQNSYLGLLGPKGIQRFAIADSMPQKATPEQKTPYTLEVRNGIDQSLIQKIIFQP